ncbi:TetR/AcrR family transcriptional regulator [Kitasatospora sp. NPDC101183]|uniref:TetR/AcrR family transcriptional regulator n=1 Tax=Kitasatospora sp. NPDC101183 TaxID=3364100 RepID=UPI0037F8B5A0
MGAARTPRDRWVEEGLTVLADSGPDAVRVEALAKRLGVTKGGFYGHFADRDALLTAMLDAWEREAIDEVLARIEREGGDPRTTVLRARELTFSSDRLLPLDLAVRNWARRDAAVAERLRQVDNRRFSVLRGILAAHCPDPAEVEARCLLLYCLAIGHHSLPADHEGFTRAEVLAKAAELILEPLPGRP